jgi:hypothetical protein
VVEGQWLVDGTWFYNPMLAIENAEIGGTLIALSVPGLKPMFSKISVKILGTYVDSNGNTYASRRGDSSLANRSIGWNRKKETGQRRGRDSFVELGNEPSSSFDTANTPSTSYSVNATEPLPYESGPNVVGTFNGCYNATKPLPLQSKTKSDY